MPQWKPFPYGDRAYRYAGDALEAAWPRLHRSDHEPFPSIQAVEVRLHCSTGLPHTGQSSRRIAESLREAWRSFHAGDFAAAVEQGLSAGPIGQVVAGRAAITYAMYLEPELEARLDILQDVVLRGEAVCRMAPEWPNAWYVHALALGRYAQGVSVMKSLASGMGTKVRQSLEHVLAREPQHADAHVALGLFQAELINKLGSVAAGLTHGARKETAIGHFDTAIQLVPESAIARIEYANALGLMCGRTSAGDAARLIEQAAACPAVDARQRLEVELARSEMLSEA